MLLKDVRSGNINTKGTEKNKERHQVPLEDASGRVGMLHDHVE